MAGQRSIYRNARSLLQALAALLVVGVLGSMFMGSRAVNEAKDVVVEQARTIVEDSLPLVLLPSDLSDAAGDVKADSITSRITPVLLDPTAFDDVAIWSTDGMIVYSTDRSLIGQRPEEARTSVRDATERGSISTQERDGMFSVLVPLRLRIDGPVNAAIQLARPNDPITAAGRPWRYNAILMTIGLILTLFILYRVMRLSNSATATASFMPARDRVAPNVPVRPIEVASPGLRVEADARRKAEERAAAAEERLNLIQDQYRKTLEELHTTQRILQERPTPSGTDAAIEERMLKAEGHVRMLEGQLTAMGTERDKLARHIAEQAKIKSDPEFDRKARQVEQEAIGLRAELEGAQTELSLTRRELDALKAQADRAQEAQEDLDAAHVEALHAREAMESAQSELARTTKELEDVRNEMRALRTEEQKASIFGEELRAAKAEIDSLNASHRAELLERETDLEERVRHAREEFQSQLAQLEERSKAQVAEVQATSKDQLARQEAEAERRIAERESALTAEAASRLAEQQREAAERDEELRHQLAERESTLQQQLAEQSELLQQRLSQSETELTARVAEVERLADATKNQLEASNADLERTRAELQLARDEIEAASHAGSSRSEQVAKVNEELVRSRTEIETLQRELAEIQRGREQADVDLQTALRERDEAQRELAATSAEVQAELARGVDISGRAERVEQEFRASREEAARASEELERLRMEKEALAASLESAETRHAAELAAVAAEADTKPDLEEVLRTSQERLASQTERLIEVEERAHSAERQFADAIVKLDEVEAELRHLHMEKALHDLQSERPTSESASPDPASDTAHREDRRASTPFTKELALDAKKSLSHILGLTQIMKFKKDSKDQAQLIKQLTTAARRLDHTVADLAEADSLAHGIVELTIKRTDLEALVKRVVEESGVASDHDVRVDSQPLVVAVDALRVEQVLAGLLRFCGDRTATGKAITVRLANFDGGALISVEDPEPSSDGSLSPVVTRFVEMQGGWTKIESRDGGGSAFRVFLPDGGPSGSAQPAPADDASEATADGATDPGTLQIVVAQPGEEGETPWAGAEGQVFVQELHRLHAED
jgi:chromosome segregation ATPase